MEKHRCKICSRRFSNGKAMGGHMRSHLAKLPIPPKISISYQTQKQQLTESCLTPSSSSSHAKQQHFSNFKSINSYPSTVLDSESDSESSVKNPTSKRARNFIESETQLVTNSVSEEDVAMCLILLSKDKWTKNRKCTAIKHNDAQTENDKRYSRSVYKCETCKKVFQSYQALGGHRASHKKMARFYKDGEEEWITHEGEGSGGIDGIGSDDMSRRIFDCPFCYKVFESGQALGGHKKVHFSNKSIQSNHRTKESSTGASSSTAKFRENWIDLNNLPAPEE